MENSNPTCFVSLEMPLTVTFTVRNGKEAYTWTSEDSEKQRYDLTDYGIFHALPKSLSASDISSKLHNNSFSTTDENFEPENGLDLAAAEIDAKSDDFKYGNGEETDFPQFSNYVDHLQDESEDTVPVLHSSCGNPVDDYCFNDIKRYNCSRNDNVFKRLDSLSSCSQFHDLIRDSQAEENETCLSDNGDNVDNCSLLNSKKGIPFTEDCCGIVEKVAACGHGNRKNPNLASDATLPNGFQPRKFLERDDFILPEVSGSGNGDILAVTEHSDTSCSRTDDSKQKNEKILMDLGYFTEEGNEGGKDEEECSNSPLEASVSDGISVKTASNGNGCCDEIQTLRCTNSQSGRSKSSILKHSRTSASFDLSSSSLTSLKDGNCRMDHYHILPNSVSAKSVGFSDLPIPVHRWCFAIDSDSSQAMERLREITNHLHLPVSHVSKTDGFTENHSQSATNQWRKINVSVSVDAWEKTDNSRINPAIAYNNVDDFFSRIKHELYQLHRADEKIAARLLVLYGEIKQYKYIHNCHLYREMMEAAIDNEDKKDELSRHHVDAIPERLCATLKQWGLTRINLQRRRFSIF